MREFRLINFYHVVFIILIYGTILLMTASEKIIQRNMPCNTTYDCFDQQMICLKNKTCACAKFYDWERISKTCIPNITKIYQWLRGTSSTEPETVFQQEDFIVKQVEPYTILAPKWAEYHGVEDEGIGHVPRTIWPLLIGLVMIIIIYGCILLEFM